MWWCRGQSYCTRRLSTFTTPNLSEQYILYLVPVIGAPIHASTYSNLSRLLGDQRETVVTPTDHTFSDFLILFLIIARKSFVGRNVRLLGM